MRRWLVPILAAGGGAVVATIAYRGVTSAPATERASPVPIEDVGTPAGPGSAEPNLAVAPDGRVYLSWLEPAPPTTGGHALRFASLSKRGGAGIAGGEWSEARTIRSGRDFFVNWADFPSLEALGDGRIAAHWLQKTGSGTYAYGVRVSLSRDDGETWSAPIAPHRDNSQTEHGFVALWPENGGAIGAAWLDGRRYARAEEGQTGGHSPSNEMMVMSTTIDQSGDRGREVILDPRVCDCCQTSAAVTASGPVVVYRGRSADEIRDIYIVRRAGGKWTGPMAVHTDGWHIAACPVNGPAVSALGNRLAVAWFTAANDSARVKVAFSRNAGATFDAPFRVDDGRPAGRVDVEMLRDGSALVSWIERIGGDTAAVRVRRMTPGGRAGPAVTIASSSAARASGFPRMALSGENAIFAWTVPGQPSSVRVARLPVDAIR